MRYLVVSREAEVEELTLEEIGRELAYRLEMYEKLMSMRERVRVDEVEVRSAGYTPLELKRFKEGLNEMKSSYKEVAARTSDEIITLSREVEDRVASFRSKVIEWAYIYLS